MPDASWLIRGITSSKTVLPCMKLPENKCNYWSSEFRWLGAKTCKVNDFFSCSMSSLLLSHLFCPALCVCVPRERHIECVLNQEWTGGGEDSVGDTAEMSHPLTHTARCPPLPAHPTWQGELFRPAMGEQRGGDLGHRGRGSVGHGVDFDWLCTLNAQRAFWAGRLTSSPLLWKKMQKRERENSRGLGALLHSLHYSVRANEKTF